MSNHPQCKLCSMGVGTEPGLSQTEIANKYGVHRRSVQRHLQHLGKTETQETNDEEISPAPTGKSVFEITGDKGTAELDASTDLDGFFRERGVDPETVNITSRRISEWQVQTKDGVETLRSQKVSFTLKEDAQEPAEQIDLPGLFSRVESGGRWASEPAPTGSTKHTVVLWADPQTGKEDINGGTEELTTRIFEKRLKLLKYVETHPAVGAHFLNLGDSVENIENTSSQLATNDLSLINQIDLEATFEQEYIRLLADTHSEVSVNVVPSNHCQLRRGKGLIGKPGDDWGIFITRQIERAFDLAGRFDHVTFNYPENVWTEHMLVDVGGVKLGLVHGHQKNSPDQIPLWWAQQMHGGELFDAELLLTGHFHHFLMRQTGQHIVTKRDKYHIQAPALDNGSAWIGNLNGSARSKAGLVVFQIDSETGLDIGSLDIL